MLREDYGVGVSIEHNMKVTRIIDKLQFNVSISTQVSTVKLIDKPQETC